MEQTAVGSVISFTSLQSLLSRTTPPRHIICGETHRPLSGDWTAEIENMANLLFDAPWWLPTILAGLGIFLFWTGNRRQESKVRNAGTGFLLAAVAVLLLSYFIDTDVEKAVKRSRTLVNSVEARDWTTLRNSMGPNVSLGMLGATDRYVKREEIVGGAKAAVEQYGVKNVHILSTSTEETDQLISVTMTVISEQDITMGRPITTSWKLEYQRSGKDWPLERITCIKIANLTGEAAARQFPAPRP
jgi:hypothetical protein